MLFAGCQLPSFGRVWLWACRQAYCKHTRKEAANASAELKSKEDKPTFRFRGLGLEEKPTARGLLLDNFVHCGTEPPTTSGAADTITLCFKIKKLEPLSLYALIFNH